LDYRCSRGRCRGVRCCRHRCGLQWGAEYGGRRGGDGGIGNERVVGFEGFIDSGCGLEGFGKGQLGGAGDPGNPDTGQRPRGDGSPTETGTR
jgi:hypothetical protein